MAEPTQEQIKEFWGFYLSTRVEQREGFWDDGGSFIEMENNPYSPHHKTKSLCYLNEDRELNEDEKATYEKDFKEGKLKVRFIPQRAQFWEEVPPVDLNNLFKCAVPKAIDVIMAKQECSSDVAYAILFKKWLQELEFDMTHPSNTLFKVLDKVKEALKEK